jgi:hypothetical protein
MVRTVCAMDTFRKLLAIVLGGAGGALCLQSLFAPPGFGPAGQLWHAVGLDPSLESWAMGAVGIVALFAAHALWTGEW